MKKNLTKVEAIFAADSETACARPLYAARVSAGFPSPADDYIEGQLDLNRHLIRHPAATYFVRVTGDSMIEAGINDGDTVIIQECNNAENGAIVVALVDNEEVTLKRLRRKGDSVALEPANVNFETRIFPPDRVRVQGRLVGLYRRY